MRRIQNTTTFQTEFRIKNRQITMKNKNTSRQQKLNYISSAAVSFESSWGFSGADFPNKEENSCPTFIGGGA